MSLSRIEDLTSLSLRDYTERLASDQPVPGGGSAAALTGALGAALAEMAARINAKRKSNPHPEESRKSAAALQKTRSQFLDLVTQDAKAFEELTLHWKKKSPELTEALKKASQVPFAIAQTAVQCLALAHTEIPRTSRHLLSDLVGSGLLLGAALTAARLNVEVNLRLIEDADFNQNNRKSLAALLQEADPWIQKLANAFGDFKA